MEATLSPAQNKQFLFHKPNSLRAPKIGNKAARARAHIWPAPVGRGRPELPGTGDWEGGKRTDPALTVTGTRCSCTGTFLGKSPSGAHQGSSKSEAHKGRRQSSSEGCQERGRGPSAARVRAGTAPTAQWKFPYPLHHEFVAAPGGGA